MKDLRRKGLFYEPIKPHTIVPSNQQRINMAAAREQQLKKFADYLNCNKIGIVFASPIARNAREFGDGRGYALANYNADIIGFYQMMRGVKTIFVLHDHERRVLDQFFMIQPSYVLLHPDGDGKYILDGLALTGATSPTGIFYENRNMRQVVKKFAKDHVSFLVFGAMSTAGEVIKGFSEYLARVGMPQKTVSIVDDEWGLSYPLPGIITKKL